MVAQLAPVFDPKQYVLLINHQEQSLRPHRWNKLNLHCTFSSLEIGHIHNLGFQTEGAYYFSHLSQLYLILMWPVHVTIFTLHLF